MPKTSAVNWKLKAGVLGVLSRIYGGRYLYRLAQRKLGTDELPPYEGVQRALEIVELIHTTGHDPTGGVFLEIGTGWRPYLPFVLYLIGAERIVSLDVIPWLTYPTAKATALALEPFLDRIAARTSLSKEVLVERYRAACSNTTSLTSILAGFHVEYVYPGDAAKTLLPAQSTDFVVSSNVLAYIPPATLTAIHRETARILKEGGLAVHRTSTMDEFAFVDRSITTANFLRFSEKEWRRYGHGLAYHNRLRCVQHKQLMIDSGFAVLNDTTKIDPVALAALDRRQLIVHSDFDHLPPNELAASFIWLVGKRNRLTSRDKHHAEAKLSTDSA